MTPPLSDTSPDVERAVVDAYRRMPAARKWRNLLADYRMARSLHAAGGRARDPAATGRDLQRDWLAATCGGPPPVPAPEPAVDPHLQDFQRPFRAVVRALTDLGIGYAVGGSVASSMHGIGRMTRDADLMVEPFAGREAGFILRFPPPEWYVSPEAVREALRNRSTFNVLHLETGFKIDFFVRTDDRFERSAFDRRRPLALPDEPGEAVLFHSPEDTVLFKLRWYRMGGEQSDRQWGDVMGVLKTQAGRLDDAYLDLWAADLGVADLLAKARSRV